MRIGLDHYTISQRNLSAEETLPFARERNLEGVQFLDPSAIDQDLDPGRLREFRRKADELGLYLEVGLPSPNPIRRGRTEQRTISPEEHAAWLGASVRAVSALGCRHARAYVGDRHDRFRRDVTWDAQIDATMEVLRHLTPTLRDEGVRIAIETHADLTCVELLRMVESLGPEVAGVTLDTGNIVMRLDDPVKAAERLAPWVLCTHVKDAILAFSPRGLVWQVRPLGEGIVPLPEVLSAPCRAKPDLNLSIELHPRTYDLPIFDPTWLACFPELKPESLAAVIRLVADCERGFHSGALPRPEEIEAIPWEERDLKWVAQSVGYLRPVVKVLESL